MGKFFINNWKYYPQNPELAKSISQETGIHPIIAQVLINRKLTDIKDVKKFLTPRLSSLKDPLLMKDMDIASERIVKAIKDKEKICIYGDFDVDGITATTMMIKFLRWVGADACYYIPDRLNEGYGLNNKAIKKIYDEGTKLLITVDNGISSFKEVEYANSIGLEVIITDHHQATEALPPALAVVNPNRPDCQYPHQSLAGAGISFKLIHAVLKKMGMNQDTAKSFLMDMIELVAMGTIADIVSLLDENRVFVQYGLKKMQKTKNVGLSTMLQLLGLSGKPITCSNVGFYIAPRLNAAGRTTHASISVELLLTDDALKAAELARYLDRLNTERLLIEEQILNDCVEEVESSEELKDEKIILVKGDRWHIGVLGIVASRLTEIFQKPAIVISVEKNLARGSARSIENYNIFEALKSCEQYLLSYGGHKRAAGLKLDVKKITDFSKAIYEHARNNIKDTEVLSSFLIDSEITPQDIDINFLESLDNLKPHGAGNPAPVFLMRNVFFPEAPKIVGKNHLKFVISKDSKKYNGIAFSSADYISAFGGAEYTWDIAVIPFINTWNGNQYLEFEIKAISSVK